MATTINSNTTDGIVITPDTSGEIELQANGVTKAKITANGLQDNNGNSLRGGSFRNLIINGDMKIAQRGTSTTGITGAVYGGPDRFQTALTTAGTWTMSQDTDVPSGQGFANSLKLECTTADASLAAGDRVRLRHSIEAQNLQHLAFGTASAKSLTLSFWVKSNKTGTYIAELFSSDSIRNISKTYSIDSADTWEKKTFTYTGDTVGTIVNDNGIGIQIYLWFGAGTTYTSGTIASEWESTTDANRAAGLTVNLADSTSNYINITGLQLEVGEGASDFEHLPYDVQLQRCQRYFVKDLNCGGSGYATGSGQTASAQTTVVYPVTMRDTPSVSYTQDGANGGNGTLASSRNDLKGGVFSEVSNVTNTRIFWYGSITLSAEL